MNLPKRMGLNNQRNTIKASGRDMHLKNTLWNLVSEKLFEKETPYSPTGAGVPSAELTSLLRLLWHRLFRNPVDTIPDRAHETVKALRSYFYDAPWFEVWDIIEFLIEYYNDPQFADSLNSVF
jgi:hypothetical protein